MSAEHGAGDHRAQDSEHPGVQLVRAEHPEEAAGEHHPFEADVDYAAALGEEAADRRERERRREHEHQVDHLAPVDDAGARIAELCAVEMADARERRAVADHRRR